MLGTVLEKNTPQVGKNKNFEITSDQGPLPPSGKPMTSAWFEELGSNTKPGKSYMYM